MNRRFRTKEAAAFLTALGDRISHRTLQGYRTRGPDDPGEAGPKWFRDPVTGDCVYFEEDLVTWKSARDSRLIERGTAPQPAQLAA